MEKFPNDTKQAAKEIVDQAWKQYNGKAYRDFRYDIMKELEDKGKK